MSELEIPVEAVQIVAAHCFGRPQTDGSVYYPDGEGAAHDGAVAALDDAAPLIVAAELRRLARLWVGDAQRPGPIGATPTEIRVRTWFQAADGLNDRADQLDPEGR